MIKFLSFSIVVCNVFSLKGQNISYSDLNKLALAMNAVCPTHQGPTISLDSVKARYQDTLVYFYTLQDSKASKEQYDKMKDKTQAMIMEKMAQNQKMRNLMKNEIVFLWYYYKPNKQLFFKWTIGPDKYKKYLK